MVSSVNGTSQIYSAFATKEIKALMEGKHNYLSIALGADGIASRQSMQPTEIYSVNLNTGESTNITEETNIY